MLQITKTRLPFTDEWGKLVCVVWQNDSVMHWKDIWTLCQDKGPLSPSHRRMRGMAARVAESFCDAASRSERIGFRPVFEAKTDLPDGAIVTVGTLYLDGEPMRVPVNPAWNGDIPSYPVQHSNNPYRPANLEFKEALGAPAYQVRAIKVDDILIADRVLIRGISFDDLHMLGFC